MTLLRLAWRNVLRHRRRALLLSLVVGYVTLAVLFMLGFLDGYGESLVESYARYVEAPVVVAPKAWWQDPDPQSGFKAPFRVDHPGVLAQTPRLALPVLLRSPYKAHGAEALGVDPGGERALSRVPSKVAEGRFLAGPGEVVLGYRLAERLDVRLGERLVVETGRKALGLRVVGILRAGVSNVDFAGVYLHLEDARSLTGVWATHLALEAPRGQEEALAQELNRRLPPGLEARGIWSLMGPIRADYEASRLFYLPLLGLFLFLAAIAVASTAYVSVRERLREFAVAESLGLAPWRLAGQVALEAALASGLGLAAGLLGGYALLWYTATHDVFGPLMRLSAELLPEAGLAEHLYTAVRPGYALVAALVVGLSALLALLFPGRLLLRMEVSAYLKEV
ncbi:ABC-type transport system, involved in lipoprotein release, permease component [Thermus arciformis]|uniref:ABC-type transport system, involved in lipoprotein release, permease component n=1 Tax=Thermus arciformis TaxID=482827 RepID=A0A1G7G2X4_9DEIN|nr:FtsX-like permease family protein [Thermus arciformis]SDE82482.1 ABC-type transport system, involved in lipoprotein release, permease component [Thermus arciformis]